MPVGLEKQTAQTITLFIKFVTAGLGSAIPHYGMLFMLVELFAVQAVAASSVGAILGALTNYMLNYRFTFQSNKKHGETLHKFLLVAVTGFVLNALFMWVGAVWLGWGYIYSQIATTVLVLLWSFTANRLWTFTVNE